MSSTVETAVEIRPFHVDIPDEALDELRRRIAATQWPEKETVADESRGVQLAAFTTPSPATGTSSYSPGRHLTRDTCESCASVQECSLTVLVYVLAGPAVATSSAVGRSHSDLRSAYSTSPASSPSM